MLWACLLFPALPLEVFARAQTPEVAARPFAVSSGGRTPRIVAANAAAHAAGVRADLLVSAALALQPDLTLREREPTAEAAALAQLATLALTLTPIASIAPPNAVVADIGGSLRLFGGLPPVVARIVSGVAALGYRVRLGLAPTPGAALLLARSGRTQPVTTLAALPEALAALPLTLVDLDAATCATLQAAGITRFGDVAALPRDALARRFGDALVVSFDRILGRVPDPRPPFVPPPVFESRLELPAPAHDATALGFALQRLVQELAGWLTARGLGVVQLELTLVHERYLRARGLAPTVVPFALGAPARAPAHLRGVLRERLERVALPAPVETILLASTVTAPLPGRSIGLLPGDDAPPSEVPLLDQLRARLGDAAVTRLVPLAEHRPERALREIDSTTAVTAHPGVARKRVKVTAAVKGWPLPEAPRPLWLLAEPQPLTNKGARLDLILRDGPERIESGWWDGSDVRRDYFVATTMQGETLWLYRDHRHGVDDGDWFLHGLFA